MDSSERKKRLVPVLLFLIGFSLVQIYHYNRTYSIYALFAVLITFTIKSLKQYKAMLKERNSLLLKPIKDLTKVEIGTLLFYLFKKQGYKIIAQEYLEKEESQYLLIQKRKKRVAVMIFQSNIEKKHLEHLKNLKAQLRSNSSFLVSIQGFTPMIKKYAVANKMTLMNTTILEAMKLHLFEKQMMNKKITNKTSPIEENNFF
ncbi:hypothetical protein [Alkalihalobacillus trypoxylicola]|uniref:Restriction endonuclease type IV Mrr domain-containing protein n=1 Tax=Alkalihalobacillus trypoxylicola TaxID=519424 RepID=A0A161PWV9_9BACI|nr:hypothetical protein [Alkalihalobacillus trypoxylicola]KYG26602.1 hypothetical protein AZF04_12385 [Alkalihalobacillus trypoxylicola]